MLIYSYAFPLNCCFHPAGHVPVHANPLSLFMFEHSIFAVPPFLGLLDVGVPRQCMSHMQFVQAHLHINVLKLQTSARHSATAINRCSHVVS